MFFRAVMRGGCENTTLTLLLFCNVCCLFRVAEFKIDCSVAWVGEGGSINIVEDMLSAWPYRIFSEFNRWNAFSSERNSSSLVGSCGITSGFLSSKLSWLPTMSRLNGSALPLFGGVVDVPSLFFCCSFCGLVREARGQINKQCERKSNIRRLCHVGPSTSATEN